MKIGLLFPGQGAQTLGMGKDIFDSSKEYREMYEKVEKLTGIDIAKISFENEELLNQTKYTQLAILTMSLALLNEIEKTKKISEKFVAGLSLGEYSALIRSGIITLEDGINLVKKRGELMQDKCPNGDWGMVAVLGLEKNVLEEICENIDGFVKPANFNTVGQIVVSGEKDGIEKFKLLAKENGAKKVIDLNTVGPFHTEKLIDAANELEKELEKINFEKTNVKVVKNLDGKVYDEKTDIKECLKKHIISPVMFEDSIKTMLLNGVDTFIEIGPGKTLTGFVKRISKEVVTLNVYDKQSLENVLSFLDSEGK